MRDASHAWLQEVKWTRDLEFGLRIHLKEQRLWMGLLMSISWADVAINLVSIEQYSFGSFLYTADVGLLQMLVLHSLFILISLRCNFYGMSNFRIWGYDVWMLRSHDQAFRLFSFNYDGLVFALESCVCNEVLPGVFGFQLVLRCLYASLH